MELLIKNGAVYDPKNGIKGDKTDISIKDGKIVDKVSSRATVIDANGRLVMPGGVDAHSHKAGAIMKARHTHEELEEIPIIDKGALTLFGSNWPTMDFVREKDMDKLAAYVAWGLLASRGYGIKVVNPGGGEMWGFGKNVTGLDDVVPNFDVTPQDIIVSLMKVNEMLGLPHSVHLHCNNLGKPGNYTTTLASMELANQVKPLKDRQVLHVTHIAFNAM